MQEVHVNLQPAKICELTKGDFSCCSLFNNVFITLRNSYTIVCPPVRGDHPRA